MAEKETISDSSKTNKLIFGVLGLNMVVLIAVAAVLYLGQKKQAQIQSLDQIAQGEHGGGEHGGGEHGGGEHGGGEHGGGEHGGATKEGISSEVRFFNVGEFTANLSGPASSHYARVNINFEMSKDIDQEEMKQRQPQFRDKIISLINSKKPADLQSSEGRNYLKDEIKTVVNNFLQKGKVEGVYFSTFIIQ